MELNETQKKIAEICDAMKDLLLHKNLNYGNSAMEPLHIFQKEDVPSNEIIAIRLDEKLARIKNAEAIRLNDICDIIGYCILHIVNSNRVSAEDIAKLKD